MPGSKGLGNNNYGTNQCFKNDQADQSFPTTFRYGEWSIYSIVVSVEKRGKVLGPLEKKENRG